MGRSNPVQPADAASRAQGAPTRRRLLGLLAAVPALDAPSASGERYRPGAAHTGPGTDPMPRLFAEFQTLLDRHEAALAACDRVEAELITRIGYPRVRLPRGADGPRRYAADAAAIAEAMPPGRRRDRLQRLLRRRQRRWDAAASAAGLNLAQVHEATLDGAVLDAAEDLLATPAWTVEAVALKLLVLLVTQEPGPSSGEMAPWRELRRLLADLSGLATRREGPVR